MGLLDKVKAQATQAAQKAQEAGRVGQAKLEESQAKRKVDALLRDLGAAVYAEKTGKPEADPAAVERLIEQIRSLEAQHDAVTASTEPAGGADQAASGTPGGSFDLSDL